MVAPLKMCILLLCTIIIVIVVVVVIIIIYIFCFENLNFPWSLYSSNIVRKLFSWISDAQCISSEERVEIGYTN